jgi:ribokinase
VAPLGDDLAGEFVRDELEQEGVIVAGARAARTPQTLVMPFGDDRAMVTVDPGARARRADVAALEPRAVAANIEQLDLLPDGAHRYITCGDDDARAFARRLPPALGSTRALFLDRSDALVLTGENTLEDAAAHLAQHVETVVVMDGAHGTLTMLGGARVQAPDFDTGAAVDTTGDRDLISAGVRLGRPGRRRPRHGGRLGVPLQPDRDDRADGHRRRRRGGAAAPGGRRTRARATAPGRPRARVGRRA